MTQTLRILIIVLSSMMAFSNAMGLIVFLLFALDGELAYTQTSICGIVLVSAVLLLIGAIKSKENFWVGKRYINYGIACILVILIVIIGFFTISGIKSQQYVLLIPGVILPVIFSIPFLLLYFHLNKIKRHKIE